MDSLDSVGPNAIVLRDSPAYRKDKIPGKTSEPPARSTTSGDAPIKLRVNGQSFPLQLRPWTTLLDALREHLGLHGTKKGCDHGQCGACTVLVDGVRINSCMTLAIMQEGRDITTIEGVGQDGDLHALQQAFIDHDAFQCGFCTPGQICSALGLLREGHATDAASLREQMSGNLCRCGAYTNITAAIADVLRTRERGMNL